MTRLIRAELLKLLRRRGTLAWSLVLTVGVIVGVYVWTGDGGPRTLRHSLEALSIIGAIAAIMLGCAAGAGDRSAGVFRDLVATGRSRWALFAARVPAVLAVVIVLAVVAAALSGLLATLLAGDAVAPSPAAIGKGVAWIAASFAATGLLALGVSSVMASQATAVGLVLGWHLVASPLLVQVPTFGDARWLLPLSALDRLEPGGDPIFPGMSLVVAAAVLVVWTVGALAAGAWRTATVDA